MNTYGEAGPALLSPCRTYRYTLDRVWDDSRPRCAFIGLNPSTADESKLDPTLRRCVRFADGWGYGSFRMLNLFALRSVKPEALLFVRDPVGPDNDKWILRTCREIHDGGGIVICCWGANVRRPALASRPSAVLNIIRSTKARPYLIDKTGDGIPKHPLYLSSDLEPEPYQ
jgi:hypothetical protein